MNDIKTFSFTADGNDVVLQLGWIPDYLKLVNVTAMSAGNKAVLEWFGALMGDAKEVEHKVIADNGTTSNLNLNYVASGGYLAQKTSTTIQTTNPVSVTGGLGVTITASGFMSDSDVIFGIAIKGDRAIAFGDTGTAAVGNTLTF